MLVFPGQKLDEQSQADSTCMPLTSKAAMLYAQVVPPENGETEFADMRAAWRPLDLEGTSRVPTFSRISNQQPQLT